MTFEGAAAGKDAAERGSDELVELFARQRLTPAQRRIARFILEHSNEVVFLGAQELARRAGVSQPSVTRFAQALGFSGYPELLAELRRVVATHSQVERTGNRYQIAVREEIRNLRVLQRSLLDAARIEQLAAQLASSQPLPVLAFRASADVASYFTFFTAKILPDVRGVFEGGSRAFDVLLQAREAGASWVLAFALPRIPRELIEALDSARELGYAVASICPDRFGPVAQGSDVLLSAPVGTSLVFDSQAAPMVLAAVLVDAIADVVPERTQARLEAFETLAAKQRYFSG